MNKVKGQRSGSSPSGLVEFAKQNRFDVSSIQLWEAETLAPYIGIQHGKRVQPSSKQRGVAAKRAPRTR